MSDISLKCPVDDCEYSTASGSENVAIALLNAHATVHTAPPHGAAPRQDRSPRLEWPKVDIGISAEEWNIFERRWGLFLKCSGIGVETAPSQLFQCAADPLGDTLLKIDPAIASRGADEVLQAMKAYCVQNSFH
jgi:hypothetical protein